MKKYPLPVIQKLKIENYDLYKCPLNIDFSNKLNVFLGTNGMGKTTLLSIIQYSIIGPYNDSMQQRNYKGEAKQRRPMLTKYFFRNRMNNVSEDAKVTVVYKLASDTYEVCHSLFKNSLLYFKLNNEYIHGEYFEYETYENSYWKNKKDSVENSLIKKYHDSIEKSCSMPDINAFIRMITNIMFFTESRKYVFWDDETSKILMSKYFMDRDKYHEYEVIQNQIKMIDSKLRLKSYEMSMLRKFMKKDNLEEEIRDIKENQKSKEFNVAEYDKIIEEITSIQEEQEISNKELNKLNKKLIEEKIKFNDICSKMNELDELWYSNLFPDDYNEKYSKYAPLMINSVCPFCGKIHDFNVRLENCILCDNNIDIKEKVDLESIDIKIKNLTNLKKQVINNISKFETERKSVEKKIIELENEINKKNILKNELGIKIGNVDDTNVINYMNYQKEKEALNNELLALKNKETEKRIVLDKEILNIFNDYKQTFYVYSKSFFGTNKKINLELVGDKEDSLFRFSLDDYIRENELELSESQRIFLDLAYRFSILTFFHTTSYFFCETPDSTLDIIYEKNAVKTFSNYIDSGNVLYLTANARSSTLISLLIEKYADDVCIVNLFNISRNGNMDDPILKLLPIFKYIKE